MTAENQAITTRVVEAIDDIDGDTWNALAGVSQPFLRHEFLSTLEQTDCVGDTSGWTPRHIVAEQGGRVVGALPLYRKQNPWGEFVFDWAWADAYRRSGLSYFPKLVSAVPFTPATGPRALSSADIEIERVAPLLLNAAVNEAETSQSSSVHVLFPDPPSRRSCEKHGFMLRKDCQFHWHNREYTNFDDFVGEMTAKKRKNVKRERRRIAEAGIQFDALTGHEITRRHWDQIMPMYGNTFWRRGREPYLSRDFFEAISARMPDELLVFLATYRDEAIAVAICFRGSDTLFGRYWGASGRFHSLHFETCYYQGIDYCIRHGIERFEPGTQGEHKISRGFVPTETWSAHWLSHPEFARAVDDYLARERDYIDDYIDVVRDHAPYRQPDTRSRS